MSSQILFHKVYGAGNRPAFPKASAAADQRSVLLLRRSVAIGGARFRIICIKDRSRFLVMDRFDPIIPLSTEQKYGIVVRTQFKLVLDDIK